jgi:uncharacterized protein YcfL
MKINLLLVVGGLLLCGCASSEPRHEQSRYYKRLEVAEFNGGGPHVKKPYGSVVPFNTDDEVKQPYEPIGFMTFEGKMSEESGILKAMLDRAADLGADAVILNAKGMSSELVTTREMRQENVNMTYRWGWMALVAGTADRYVYRAQAIRYKNAQPTSTRP